MRETIFRSWNEMDQCFYYFTQGLYFDSLEFNNEVDAFCFKWTNAEELTGLTDKNGSKIFEGDVIALPYITPMGQITSEEDEDLRTHVIYENGEFALRNTPLSEWIEREEGEYIPNHGNKVIFKGFLGTVIGNIHESLTPNK